MGEYKYKPIETEYKGDRFRSRLEARWAVFFDEMKIKYQYEPQDFFAEGIDGTGYRYLPDFYLPELDTWVEVKPSKQKLLEEEKKISVCIDWNNTPISSSNGLLILGQIPYYDWRECDKKYPAFPLFRWYKGVESTLAVFVKKYGTRIITDLYPIDRTDTSLEEKLPEILSDDDLLFWKTTIAETRDGLSWFLDKQDQRESNLKLWPCFIKARQARFEYGETPR